jgi:hypothetical protein
LCPDGSCRRLSKNRPGFQSTTVLWGKARGTPTPRKLFQPFHALSEEASITGELTVSWSHRNRPGTWSYADSGKTTTAEPGIEYDILVYGELGTLARTETGLTGTSWTYLEADEIAESGLGRLNNHLRVAGQDPDVRGRPDPLGDPGDRVGVRSGLVLVAYETRHLPTDVRWHR